MKENSLVRDTVALEYFDAGWHPLPIPAQHKGPPPAGLTGTDGRDMTRDDVAALRWNGNIGVRMPVDVIGLDVDAYHGGKQTLDDLKAKLGPLPFTRISHSNRGDQSGIRFFRVPAGLLWVTSLPGMDIVQRTHRYALVAPSVHPEGRAYGWFDQSIMAAAEIVPRVDELPELPWEWIGELSRAASTDVRSHAVDADALTMFVEACATGEAQGYASAIVQHFVDETSRDVHRARHDSMQHCLTWGMEYVRCGVLGSKPTLQALAERWHEALMATGETRRAEVSSPSRCTEFEAMVRHAVGKANAKTNDELLALRHAVIPPIAVPEPEPEGEQKLDVYHHSALYLNWDEFEHRDVTERFWLVEDFWPEGRAMALWADAKEGKSELALWCAAKLAMGEDPWTGVAQPPLDIAYFDFEMTADDLDDRITGFGFGYDRLAHLHYALLPPMHTLDSDDGGKELLDAVRSVGAVACVIDTFTGAVGGEEDKADTVRAFTRHTGLRLKQAGVAYLRTDHAGKKRTKGPRGTSAKQQDVDVTWELHRTSTGVTLSCEKGSRLSWVGPTLKIERNTDPVTGDVSYSRPVRMGWSSAAFDKARELDEIGVPLDAGRGRAIKALRESGKTPGKNAVLGEALSYRKGRGQVPGTGLRGVSGTG
jgi:hypothetical protein